MATYGLNRLVIRTNWSKLEWVINCFIGQHYPSLGEFGLCAPDYDDEEEDFATCVQNDDAQGGIAFLQGMLEKYAETDWVPRFWHMQSTYTFPGKGGGAQQLRENGKFFIETHNGRVQLTIFYRDHHFWVDVRYSDPTLSHIRGYTDFEGKLDVWCEVVNPDGTERGLPLRDLPKMVAFWNGEGKCPMPKQYPFVGQV